MAVRSSRSGPAALEPLDRRPLRPVECHDLVRLGQSADGGYVVPRQQVDRTHVDHPNHRSRPDYRLRFD